ncbi:hypothetical protein F5Y13DRAFT_191021 [Hypoxylon sp. FL1857]|nr:hypothetical protein F5Y13DRAFT_191021 [Hypoxylon sp. FL1857]
MYTMSSGIKAPPEPCHGEAYGTDPFELSHAAFQEGLRIFKESLTRDSKKIRLADKLLENCTLNDVLKSVIEAKDHYESKRGTSKFREMLAALSQRLVYYGNVVDVLVQHHPEYVSLVWGAMKLIFGAVVEHERTGMAIVTAVCEISDSLPTVELAIALYPNAILKRSVSMLYAHIVRFLIRAWRYYEESKLSHAIHSITRPVALRYDDLIQSIQRETEAVRKHMAASSQAEIRDLHTRMKIINDRLESGLVGNQDDHQKTQAKIGELVDVLTQIQQTMDFERAVHASAQIQTRAALSDIQLQQALAMVSSQCSINHKSVLGSAVQLSKQRQVGRRFQFDCAPFWTSPKLREWTRSQASSTILIKSPYRARPQIRTFCTEVVGQLVQSRTVVLWVLVERGQTYPLLEALKSLVFQALSLSYSSRTENRMTFQLSQFLDAHTEEDHLAMLASLLQHFKLVYIIANGEAMSPDTALQCRQCLRRLSCILSDRGSQTLLKVITTSNGPEPEQNDKLEDLVLTVGRMNRKRIHKQLKGRARKHTNLLVNSYSQDTWSGDAIGVST